MYLPGVYYDGTLSQIMNGATVQEWKSITKVLKNQNVPRKKASEGIPLEIYKRCGWEPSEKNLSEREELDKRREWIREMGASKDALAIIDHLSENYERHYNYSP